MLTHDEIIQKFIPTVTSIASLEVDDSYDSFDYHGQHYMFDIRRSDPPYAQKVCLFIDNRPHTYPMQDTNDDSLVEAVSDRTGITPIGYFLVGGKLIADQQFDYDDACISIGDNYRFACLYLLR